jgi:hypothetical protein
MATYDADPQELARRTRILEEVSKGVNALFEEHQTQVERIGDVWGTDEMGEQFSRRYVPSSKDFNDYSHNLSLGVRTSIDAVVETARRIHITEHENIEHGKARPK